jgi:lactate dehydrogenase-like 2-hydroxyacid dehydrogenase
MKVLLAERKSVPAASVRAGRTAFTETLTSSTIIMMTLPLSAATVDLISTPEFALMRADAVLVNVARGGVVDEDALVFALKERRIRGAAVDVFVEEPAGVGNSVLVRAAAASGGGEDGGEEGGLEGRLVLSPHVAWYARSSIEKLRRTVRENVEGWARGEAQNLVS